MAVVTVDLNDGHKEFTYQDWFQRYELPDTGAVVGVTAEIDLPLNALKGLPYEGYYRVDWNCLVQEWDAGMQRLPQITPHVFDVKGSGEAYFNTNTSLHYFGSGVGMVLYVWNNSFQGSAIVYVTGATALDRRIWLRFTGTQIGTTSVQISGGYAHVQYVGKELGIEL